MAEYIEREAAINASKIVYIEYIEVDGEGYEDGNADEIPVVFKRDIEAIPAADVVPVRHGRWINICGDRESPRQCSECLQDFDYIDGICYLVSGQRLPRYCPACGALMDKDGDEYV